MMSPRRHRPIKNLIFSGIAVLTFFVLMEGALLLIGVQPKFVYRSFELPFWVSGLDPAITEEYKKQLSRQGAVNEDIYAYRSDADLEWMLKSGIEITVKNYSLAIPVDTMPKWTIVSDQNGFRVGREGEGDTELPNTLYVLGDSSSFGWGVDFGETYGAILKDHLDEGGKKKYALVNYSIPGFTSFQGRLLADRMARIKPDDLVLVSFGWNDAYASVNSDRKRFEERHSFFGQIKAGLNKLRSYRLLKSFMAHEREEETVVKKNDGRRVPLKDYEENLRYIFQSVRQKKGRLLFVSVCNGGEYFKTAKKVSQSMNVPFFDFPELLLPYLSRLAGGEIQPDKYQAYVKSYGSLMKKDRWLTVLFPDKCHPNAIGHYLMGKIIYDGVKGLKG